MTLLEESPPNEVVIGELDWIPLDDIEPSPDNLRRKLGDIEGLAVSIVATNGPIEPPIVERLTGGKFRTIAGHRRLAACRLPVCVDAGITSVQCIIRDAVNDASRIELMLIENLQREGLDPLEEATGYGRLVELGLTQKAIAERVGCSQSHVSKRVALLELPPAARKALDAGKLDLVQAQTLTRLREHPEKITEILKNGRVWALDREVDDYLEQLAYEELAAPIVEKAKAKGWKVVTEDRHDASWRKIATKAESWNRLELDAKAHRKEPCHGLLVRRVWGRKTPDQVDLCMEPARHTAKGDSELKLPKGAKVTGGGKREKSKYELAEEQRDQARKVAGGRRDEALPASVAKKIPRYRGVPLVVNAVIGRCDYIGTAARLLGLVDEEGNGDDEAMMAEAAKGSDEALRVAVACVLADAHETAKQKWHGWADDSIRAMYRFLVDAGYEVDEYETVELGLAEELVERADQLRADMLAAASREAGGDLGLFNRLSAAIGASSDADVAEYFEDPEFEGMALAVFFELQAEA